jgi:thiosulfate reductase cytochrome b subunit
LRIHPGTVRVVHWTTAFAVICMMLSGWRIYDASPLFDFTFPPAITLGGWLAGAIAWLLAAMWLLVASFVVYLVYGIASGHFRRRMFPVRPGEVAHDLGLALRFRLPHRIGMYNAVQRVFYLGVIVALLGVIASGFSIWKPVQFAPLTALFGGYDTARYVHFFCMAAIAAFIVVHLALVALVPRVLPSMITGGRLPQRGPAE